MRCRFSQILKANESAVTRSHCNEQRKIYYNSSVQMYSSVYIIRMYDTSPGVKSVLAQFKVLYIKHDRVLKTWHYFASSSLLLVIPPLKSAVEMRESVQCDLSINCSIERIGELAFSPQLIRHQLSISEREKIPNHFFDDSCACS